MIQDTKILQTLPKELCLLFPEFSNERVLIGLNACGISRSGVMFLNLSYLKSSKMAHNSGKSGQISIW